MTGEVTPTMVGMIGGTMLTMVGRIIGKMKQMKVVVQLQQQHWKRCQ